MRRSWSADEKVLGTNRQITPHRGRVFAVLLAVLLVGGLSTEIVATDQGNWQPAWALVYSGAMALFPLLLARLAPTAASFDTQWLPSSRRHWAWFFGMLVVSFVLKLLVPALAVVILGTPPEPSGTLSEPIGFIFQAIGVVLVGPVAEEIFFRGYLLEQLRKLVRSHVALLAQAFLFALSHLYAWGFNLFSFLTSLDVLLFGLIAGLWRIRFRSLLPIVLTHSLCNAPCIFFIVEEYDRAVSLAATRKLYDRAEFLFEEGKHAAALCELNRLIELNPTHISAHYFLGWIYATSPDPGCRDKEKALFHATRLTSLLLHDAPDEKEHHWMAWACLAAAHAERGDFDKAIENQRKAIECLSTVSEEWRPRFEPRVKAALALYAARKPLRTQAKSLGGLSDTWVESMLHPDPNGFPEIAQ